MKSSSSSNPRTKPGQLVRILTVGEQHISRNQKNGIFQAKLARLGPSLAWTVTKADGSNTTRRYKRKYTDSLNIYVKIPNQQEIPFVHLVT